jgi:hypothetical protein
VDARLAALLDPRRERDDRLSDLGLVGTQRDLIEAFVEAGKPVVIVFVNGKPVAMS